MERNLQSKTRRLLVGAAVAVVGLTLAACSGTGDSTKSGGSTSSAGAPINVTMVTHGAASNPFFNPIKNGADAAAKALNVNFDYQSPQDGSEVEEARLIKAAIAKKPDALIVTIPNPDAESSAIKAAVDAGIPVFAFNAGVDVYQKLGVINFVGQSEKLAGQEAGKQMAKAGVKKLLCVIQQQGITDLYTRCNGAKETMGDAGGEVVQLAVDGNDPTSSQRQIAAALTADPSVDGILTLGTIGFDPAYKALGELKKYGDVKIGTFDLSSSALDAVKAGNALFVVDQQQYLQGYMPVQFAAQYVRYGLAPIGQILTGPAFVTKDNVDQVAKLVKDGIR
jgi:simple sugar transport system substrate-binding protein